MVKRHSSKLIALMMLCLVGYGLGRLYFELTAGFRVAHISSDLTFDPRFEAHGLDSKKEESVRQILSQEFRYLGKGCQSYVFLSDDGQYVLKFLKYQRFRPQKFLSYFSFIPFVEKYRQKKILQKKEKLEKLFASWKIAFENLDKETGLIFLHLNKTSHLNTKLTIYDKLGIKHVLNVDDLEFLVQKRADMLCPTITKYMKAGHEEEAKSLLTSLVDMIISEYQRGFGDNDHALMQNTGVIEGQPVHIDVGQFVADEQFKRQENYNIELFSKTFKFRIWLSKHFPELESFLSDRLLATIGPEMKHMKPRLKTVDEGA